MTMLSESQIAEIEAEITARDDSTALESACGEYNCSCHDRLPALCQTVRALQTDVDKFSALADERHDQLCEARRQRDSLAAYQAKYTREVINDFRTRVINLCNAKAAEYERAMRNRQTREAFTKTYADAVNEVRKELEVL